MKRLEILCLVGLALQSLAAFGVSAEPLVSFESSTYQTTEGAAVVVTVVLSEPPTSDAWVDVVSESDLAHEGVDFVTVDEELHWTSGDGSSRDITVQTLDDEIPEDFEWFELVLEGPSGSLTLGEPSTTTIYIPNDDGVGNPIAWIGVDDAHQTSDGFEFEAEAGTSFEIPIRLSTIPNPPVTVDYVVTLPPTFSGSLLFDNTDERILEFDAPWPKNGLVAYGELSVSISGGRSSKAPSGHTGVERGGGVTTAGLESFIPPLEDYEECFFCWWAWVMHIRDPIFGCPGACIVSKFCDPRRASWGTNDPNPGLDALRRYRDEILTTTPAGQRFIGLYDMFVTDAGRTLLRDPRLALNLFDASQSWLGPLQALLDGNGDMVTVTPEMLSRLFTVLNRMVAAGSPELANALTAERERLQLDATIGLTMTELQSQIELLGDTPVQEMSWSRIKAHFRD